MMMPSPTVDRHVARKPVAMATDDWFERALARELAPLPLDTRQCCRAVAEWIVSVTPMIAAVRNDLDVDTLAHRMLGIGAATIGYVAALRLQTCGSAR